MNEEESKIKIEDEKDFEKNNEKEENYSIPNNYLSNSKNEEDQLRYNQSLNLNNSNNTNELYKNTSSPVYS